MILTTIGLSALLLARIQGNAALSSGDIADARLYAQAALDMGRYAIAHDASWRTNRPTGVWFNAQTIGKGQFTLEAADPVDGNIAVGASDPVVFTGTGAKGNARQIVSVTVVPQNTGLDSLDIGVQVGGAVTLNSAVINADRTVASNVSVTAVTSNVQANVEAVGAIVGATYAKSTTTGVTARSMPASTAFDYYITNGTSISIGSVPSVGGKKTIEKRILSASTNTLGGGTNPNGIYVLDCQSTQLIIQNCRIVATLVLLNPGLNTQVTQSVLWQPPAANYPTLLVRGDVTISTSQSPLSEPSLAVNFNPPTNPYQGLSNANTLDTYPSGFSGLVYISGNATFLGYNTFSGAVIVGGTLTCSLNAGTAVAARLDLTYNNVYYTNPPPGFAAPTRMVVSPGSFKQVVN